MCQCSVFRLYANSAAGQETNSKSRRVFTNFPRLLLHTKISTAGHSHHCTTDIFWPLPLLLLSLSASSSPSPLATKVHHSTTRLLDDLTLAVPRLAFSSFVSHSLLDGKCCRREGLHTTHRRQAHRVLAQVVITGSRVLGRAFVEAYRQASASKQFAAIAAKDNPQAMNNLASSGLTLDEACKILNVKPPMAGKTNMESVMERFKRLYDLNNPQKGGSFYLQSKILRARERIEMEVREAERKAITDKQLKEGWRPKVYQDR
jgi:mitochondrial import inner membrane translocase subunit TIM16